MNTTKNAKVELARDAAYQMECLMVAFEALEDISYDDNCDPTLAKAITTMLTQYSEAMSRAAFGLFGYDVAVERLADRIVGEDAVVGHFE